MSDSQPQPAGTRVHLSGVASVAHLAYASAYLRALLADRATRVEVVDVGVVRFRGAARVTAADFARLLPVTPRLRLMPLPSSSPWRVPPGSRPIYLAVGAPGLKVYLRLLAANRRWPWCVVVDEGLGSYGTWRTRWDAARRQGGHGVRPLVRSVAVSLALRHLTDERWPLYRRAPDGRWRTDPDVAASLGQPTAPVRSPKEPWVLWISQPWVELGRLEADRYLQVLATISEACTAAGLRLYVRPHPAEQTDRYAAFLVDDTPGPVELGDRARRATAVLGLTSTALINLSAVQAVPVWRVRLPELDSVELGLSRAQRELLTAFVPPPVGLDQLPGLLAAIPRPSRSAGSPR